MSLIGHVIRALLVFFLGLLEGLHAAIGDNCLWGVSEVPIEIVFIDFLERGRAFGHLGCRGISALPVCFED